MTKVIYHNHYDVNWQIFNGFHGERHDYVTTDTNHRLPVAANWLNQEFTAAQPNEKWVADPR
jgi:hypothetical protein